jgi:S1-C subfamily serine protease
MDQSRGSGEFDGDAVDRRAPLNDELATHATEPAPEPTSPGGVFTTAEAVASAGPLPGPLHVGDGTAAPTPPGWAELNWAPPRPPDQKGRRLGPKAAALSLGALVLLGAGVGLGRGLSQPASTAAASSTSVGGPVQGSPQGGSSSGSGATDVSAIASKVDPGLVDINTTLSYQQEQAAGTGMVLTSSGEVLTNNHVIEGATSISVTDIGNGKTYGATVVGYDISNDVAVLQLTAASGLQTVSIGDSSNVSVGQSVVGVGNAGGTGGTPSAAGGAVTALNQSITASDEGNDTSEQLEGLIAMNADIQPGDSGGPLVNQSGQVIGIDTAGSSSFQVQSGGGSGFAIPINTAIGVAKQIEAGQGSSTIHIGLTSFLGVEVQPTSGAGSSSGGFSSSFGQGGAQESGVAVAGVVTGDPADEAGLTVGDVITSLSGTTITTPSDLTAALIADHPGDTVQIGWTDQSGQSHTASVQLASGPPA